MNRFLTSRIGACALVSTLAIGSTIGWIEAAGGSTEAVGGATLSISISPLAFNDQDPLTGVSLIFFVQGPRFYKQVAIPKLNSGTGSLTTPTITVPTASAGVYEIGAVAEFDQASGTFDVTLSGTPMVTSSLGGVEATSFSVSGTNANEQGVSSFVYRNGLIP